MKNELLNKWLSLREKGKEKVKEEATNRYPLAYNQQALYFLNKLYPDNPFYNYLDYYLFEGNLNIDLLIKSFELIIERHEVFRTKFVEENDQPVQIVEEKGELEIIKHQLIPFNQDEKEAREVIVSDARKAFDLGRHQQLRLSIVQFGEQLFAVGVIAHHIIIDKWSMSLIRAEVSKIYKQLLEGKSTHMGPLPTTFGQYAKRQVERNIDNALLQYWLEKLEFDDERLKLPTDFISPSGPTFQGRHYSRKIKDELSIRVVELCKELSVTPFVFLLSVFNLLLYKYSGKKSINIGVPFSNKSTSDLEKVIGFFDETVILRTKIENSSFLELINRIKEDVYLAFEKKQIPLELLVREINPDRGGGVNPLFQVMFIYHKKPAEPDFGKDIMFSSDTIDLGVTKFDLSLFVGDVDGDFYISFEYATDLFREETIGKMADHFTNLLTQVVEGPSIPIPQLSLLSKANLERFKEFSKEKTFDVGNSSSILDLISKQVKDKPSEVAVADDMFKITYAELNKRADNIAYFLQVQGVKKGAIVGLLFSRSVDMIVAILGVLRSGAGYLPLDPEYPETRIKYMKEDAGISLIIGDVKSEFGFDFSVYPMADIEKKSGKKDHLPEIGKEDVAYIIYTSGSTGKPKGVSVTHGNLLNSTLARSYYYADAPKSFLLFSSFSFDSSVAGIFWTLCTGGKLVISGQRLEQDADKLGNLLKREAISHTLLLPGLYKEILLSLSDVLLQSLQCVILAGETIDQKLPEEHYRKLPDVRLFNEYGPTEATVWASVEELKPDDGDSISIGKPIANTQIFILDQDLQPQPTGIPGEIYIGGDNVAPGYLHNPTATRERFIDHPFIDQGGKLYKTGDLGKFTEEGKIVFLGRADGQVKIRGYRIELGEIERKLRDVNGLDECVVQIKSKGKAKFLACYFTQKNEISSEDIRAYLLSELPDYMVPTAYIKLEEMPRLPNGKINVKGLPDGFTRVSKSKEVPKNTLESILLGIWKEVLNNEDICINDNFFEVGGDSITSIRIISKAKNMGLIIKPNLIFKYQSIRELVPHIKSEETRKSVDVVKFFGESMLTPIQHWFFQRFRSAPNHWNLAYRITFKEKISDSILLEILQSILNKYDALRQTFHKEGDVWKTIYKNIEVEDCISRLDDKTLKQGFHQLQKRIDIREGPLIRMILIQYSQDQVEFDSIIIVAHHLVIDTVSWSILIDDFNSAAKLLMDRKRSELTADTNQFKTWSDFINSAEANQVFQSELEFWKGQTRLRTNLKSIITKEKEVATIKVIIDATRTKKLLDEAINAYHSRVHELVIVAYLLMISDIVKDIDVTVWMEHHGRKSFDQRMDFSNAIGWFTSYYPIRFNLDESIKSNIINVKEKLRSIPNDGIGYGYHTFIKNNDSLKSHEEFTFNYNGIEENGDKGLISSVDFIFDHVRSPESEVYQLVDLNCAIKMNRLHCHFRFNAQSIAKSEMKGHINKFEGNLNKIIDHCLNTKSQFTASDFPDADLSSDDLNTLLGQL